MMPPPISPSPAPSPVGPPPGAGGDVNKLALDPNLLSKAKGSTECEPGSTYKVNLTVRANTDGGFDVVDTEPLQMVDGAAGPLKSNQTDDSVLDESEEEKVLGYKRPQRKGPNFI